MNKEPLRAADKGGLVSIPRDPDSTGIAVHLLQAKEIAYQFHMLCKRQKHPFLVATLIIVGREHHSAMSVES